MSFFTANDLKKKRKSCFLKVKLSDTKFNDHALLVIYYLYSYFTRRKMNITYIVYIYLYTYTL